MSDPASFTDDENWTGGFYELAIELGDRDDARLEVALARAWADPSLNGCYVERHREPEDQRRVAPSLAAQSNAGHLRGTALLPNHRKVVCGSVVIREEGGSDWLDLYLPLGALSRADERVGAYPFGSTVTVGDERPSSESLVWRQPIDAWFFHLAASIFRAVPFRLGLIGFETSGATTAAELTSPPAERSLTYLIPTGGDLTVHRATASS